MPRFQQTTKVEGKATKEDAQTTKHALYATNVDAETTKQHKQTTKHQNSLNKKDLPAVYNQLLEGRHININYNLYFS